MTISTRPDVMGGQPFIAGTSITVVMILRRLAQGKTPEQIVAELPGLTLDNVHEAEVYAGVTQTQPGAARIWRPEK